MSRDHVICSQPLPLQATCTTTNAILHSYPLICSMSPIYSTLFLCVSHYICGTSCSRQTQHRVNRCKQSIMTTRHPIYFNWPSHFSSTTHLHCHKPHIQPLVKQATLLHHCAASTRLACIVFITMRLRLTTHT